CCANSECFFTTNRNSVGAITHTKARRSAGLLLLSASHSSASFRTQVILSASAATATDGSDHLSTGANRDPSNARKSLAAQDSSDITPEGRGRFSPLGRVLARVCK